VNNFAETLLHIA